jgi:hypothetical protein
MKPGSMKFDPLHFGWFDLHLDPFFEEIINLCTEMPILASSTCYTKNSDRGTRNVVQNLANLGYTKPISSVIYAKLLILIRYMCVQDVDLQILGSESVKFYEINERC